MKNFLIMSFVSFASVCTNAMEQFHLKTKEESNFTIKNNFPETVRVVYVLDLGERELKEEFLDINPGQEKNVPDWQKIVKLVVGPYGKWKSQATREILGLKPYDYQLELREVAKRHNKADIKMTIGSGAPGYEFMSGMKPMFEKFFPYDVNIFPLAEKVAAEGRVPESGLLKDALPRVKRALETGEQLIPRHTFGVGPDMPLEGITRDYEQMVAQWQRTAQSNNPEKVKFAKKMLQHIKSAYDLIAAQAAYKESVEQDITMTK